MDLVFNKLDESFARIESDDLGIIKELSEYLTFDVPNATFMPAYKKGWWDGKFRLLDTKTQLVYTGLYPAIKRFCTERRYNLSTKNFSDEKQEIDADKMKEIIMSWKPTKWVNGIKGGERESITPYKEQLLSIYIALVEKRLLIESATSAGKSFIIWALIRLLNLKRTRKTLIIVHRVDLVNQLHDNKDEYFGDWDIGIDILYAGKELTDAPVVISTWQSICKMPKSYFEQFEVLIEDEVHRGEAKSTCSIVENCVNAHYRVGLTGTLKESKTHRMTLNGLFGKDFLLSTASENIKKGISAPLEITIFRKKWNDYLKPASLVTRERYQHELEYIKDADERNQLIKNLSNASKGTNVVLFRYKEHGQKLFDMLRKENNDTFLIHGEVNQADREKIKQLVIENPDKNINIVASIGTFSDGINIPNIKSVILTCPLKGDNTSLRQSIGRGLRLKKDGGKFVFFDLVDYLGVDSILERHAQSRIETYIKQEFQYKIVDY